MLLTILFIIIGFVGLLWSADRLVLGASNIALIFGMPAFLIGLTVIAIGTSAPELFICVSSALKQQTSIAVGNAVGSNTANIGLVVGLSALIKPMQIHKSIVQRELPLMLIISLTISAFLWPLTVYRWQGFVMVGLFVLITGWFIYQANHHREEILIENVEIHKKSLPIALFWLLVGLIMLPISSDFLVTHAVELAKIFGMSEIMIGLTILAIGSSLPELAASAVSAYKNHNDLAIGNVVGSNLFNLTFALGPAVIIHPSILPTSLRTRDLPFMLGMTFILFLIAMVRKKNRVISRFMGGFLFGGYIIYLYVMILGELSP